MIYGDWDGISWPPGPLLSQEKIFTRLWERIEELEHRLAAHEHRPHVMALGRPEQQP